MLSRLKIPLRYKRTDKSQFFQFKLQIIHTFKTPPVLSFQFFISPSSRIFVQPLKNAFPTYIYGIFIHLRISI